MKLNINLVLALSSIQSITSVFAPSKEYIDAFERASRSNQLPPSSDHTNTPLGIVKSKMGSKDGARFLFNAVGLAYCPRSKIEAHNEAHNGEYSQRLSNGFKLLKVFEDNVHRTQSYIVDFVRRKEMIIVFRGIDNQNNWNSTLDVKQVPLDTRKQILVHSGFKRITDGVAPVMIDYLKKLYSQPNYRDYILVTAGHSLGGALATLSLIKYREALQLPWERTHLFTYGTPRIGNKPFVNWINSKPFENTRVVNRGDLMPTLPKKYYAHIHTEYYLEGDEAIVCRNSTYEDPRCSSGNKSPKGSNTHIAAWGMTLDNRYC